MTNTRRATIMSRNGDDRLNYTKNIKASVLDALPLPGLLQSASTNNVCQGVLRSFGSGGFLLLNFKSPHRDNFALSLRLHRRKVIVPEEQGKSYSDLTDDEIRNADYIYCDLTRKISHDEFQKMRRICNLQKRDGMPLLVACWILEEKENEGFQRTVEKFLRARIVLCKKPLK